jgi:hypothetical protein
MKILIRALLFLAGLPRSEATTVKLYDLVSSRSISFAVFILPRTVHILKSTLPGTIVSKVKATDPDEGMNGSVKYLIDMRNDSGLFQIYPQLGDIVLQKNVESLSGKKYIIMQTEVIIVAPTSTTTIKMLVFKPEVSSVPITISKVS